MRDRRTDRKREKRRQYKWVRGENVENVCAIEREKVEIAKGERTEKVTDSTEKGVREEEKVEIGV